MPLRPLARSTSQKETHSLKPGSLVEYEQHGQCILAIITGNTQDKWNIVSETGEERALPGNRLYLFHEQLPFNLRPKEQIVETLKDLLLELEQTLKQNSLEKIWKLVRANKKEYSAKELCTLSKKTDSLIEHLTMRRALVNDKVYFKRGKVGFEPRDEFEVKLLENARALEKAKEKAQEEFLTAAIARSKNSELPLPAGIERVREVAALGKSSPYAKELKSMLDTALERLNLPIEGPIEERAHAFLLSIGASNQDETYILERLGRPTFFTKIEEKEAQQISNEIMQIDSENRENLDSLFIVTIDNEDTTDIDDGLSLVKKESGFQLGIHISDVASYIDLESALFKQSIIRATSIYCADCYVPMLPPALSDNALSLLKGELRPAVSFFFELNEIGEIKKQSIIRSLIKVREKLSYETVDAILYNKQRHSELDDLLWNLWDVSCMREAHRISDGAVHFNRRDLSAYVDSKGIVTLKESDEQTPGHRLVSEMMILANESAALFASQKGTPLYFRGQEAPEEDNQTDELRDSIPDGPAREYFERSLLKRSTVGTNPVPHASLGIRAYAQVTSPLRRVVDLINQHQLISTLQGKPCLDESTLESILREIEPNLDQAQRAQRTRNRYWMQKFIAQQHLETFRAVIVRADGNRPLAEIEGLQMLHPFSPNQEKGDCKLRIGESVQLKVERNNPRKEQLQFQEI